MHSCPITMYDEEDTADFVYDLAQDVDERSTVALNMSVQLHAQWVGPVSDVNVTCPACGPCDVTLFGAKTVFSNFPCPLHSGHHSISKASSNLGLPVLTHLTDMLNVVPTVDGFEGLHPDGFQLDGRWKMVRPGGGVVFEVAFALRA
eukprot:UN4993